MEFKQIQNYCPLIYAPSISSSKSFFSTVVLKTKYDVKHHQGT